MFHTLAWLLWAIAAATPALVANNPLYLIIGLFASGPACFIKESRVAFLPVR